MIDDMLDIVLDPLIPPKNDVRNGRANNFELIYSEGAKPVNQREPYTTSPYPFPELDPRQSQQKIEPNAKVARETEELKMKIEKGRSASVESTKDHNFVYLSSVEAIYKNLYAHLNYKSEINPNVVGMNLTKVLGILANWELLSDKHISLACKSLLLIANSAANVILTDQNHILAIAKLISSGNMKLEIQLAAVMRTFELLGLI